MRVERSLKNGMISVISQLILTITTFVIRTVIIYSLSIEYAGLQGLFSGVISVLTLAEMGVYTSMVNYLYKPLALGEAQRVKNIIALLNKIYKGIIIVTAVAGFVILFFVDRLIFEQPFSLNYLRIVYLLTLVGYIFNYMGVEQRILLFALEEKYVYTKIDIITTIISFLLQVVALVFFKSYLAYLVALGGKNLAANLWVRHRAKRLHPAYHGPYERDKALEKSLFKDTKNAMAQRISETVLNATDSIVISSLRGLALAGSYANYQLLFQTVRVLYNQFFDSVQSSFGGLIAQNGADNETTHALYKTYNFISYFIGNVCFCCFLSLTQPFIALWVTPDLQLSNWLMVFMSVNFLINILTLPITQLYFVLRLYNVDRWSMITSSLANIALSLLFIHFWDVEGVILATVLSSLLMVCARYYYVFRYGFKSLSGRNDLFLLLGRVLLSIALGAGIYYLNSLLFSGFSFLSILARLGVCLAASILINCLLFWRTREFQLLLYKAKQLLGSIGGLLRQKFGKR